MRSFRRERGSAGKACDLTARPRNGTRRFMGGRAGSGEDGSPRGRRRWASRRRGDGRVHVLLLCLVNFPQRFCCLCSLRSLLGKQKKQKKRSKPSPIVPRSVDGHRVFETASGARLRVRTVQARRGLRLEALGWGRWRRQAPNPQCRLPAAAQGRLFPLRPRPGR